MKIRLPWRRATETRDGARSTCKTCGRPLASRNRYDECESCRREKAGVLKTVFAAIGAALLGAAMRFRRPLLDIAKGLLRRR